MIVAQILRNISDCFWKGVTKKALYQDGFLLDWNR